MATPPTAPADPETAGPPETPQPSRDPERRLLRPDNRLPMAHATARVPAVEDGVPLLPGLAHRRHLGEDEPGDAKTAKGAPWPRSRTPSAGIVDSQSAKTTGVGGEQRGFDGGKKVRGRKRHILVDTEGLVVEARVHSAKVPDQDGIRRLLEPARDRLPCLSYLWVDAGYRGRGREWAEEALGAEVEVVNRSPKPTPEKVLRIWAREWFKGGREMDLSKLPKRPAFEKLPRRWVAERTFA